MQMLLGLYFSEICLIGLFSLRGAFIPVVLTAILFVLTGLVHASLIDALGPLLWSLPKSLTVEEDQHLLGSHPPFHNIMSAQDPERFADRSGRYHDFEPELEEQEEGGEVHIPGDTRAVEGASHATDTLRDGFKSIIRKKVHKELPEVNIGLSALSSFWMRWISPDPDAKSNWLLRWLHPEVYSDFTVLRREVPSDLPDPVYPDDVERDIYYPPSFLARPPTLWIPRDPAGVSRQEVAHTGKVIPVTDEHVTMDEKGALSVNLEQKRLVFDIDRLRY